MKQLVLLFAMLMSINLMMAQNLATNPGFETWTDAAPDGWNGSKSNIGAANIVQYSTSVHSGLSACQLINTTSSHKRFTTQPVSVVDQVEYTITFWVRGVGDIRTALFDGVSGSYGYTDYNPYISVNSTEWVQESQSITAGGTVDDAEFIFSIRNTVADNDHLQIDDVEIVAAITPDVIANFEADETSIFNGNQVQFSDLSFGTITSWFWSFEGGTPTTSNEQNPTVTYNAIGTYDVQLIVSDGTTNDTLLKDDYINVTEAYITILDQDWNDQQWNGWQQISVIGEQVWSISPNYGIDNSPCAKMTGYSGGAIANEDWLISPAFNLSTYEGVNLSFQNAYKFAGNALEVFFSNNFDGTTPSTATWSPLTFVASTGNYVWTPSGNIALDDFTGTNCYIAFKYTCDDAAASTWEIDDILLTALQETPQGLTADFSGTPTTIFEGETVTFTDASTGNPTSWIWVFEGGNPPMSFEQNPVVTYATAGTYNVALTVSDGTNEDTKTVTDYITVVAAPVGPTASFTASSTTINVGETVSFTNTSTGTVTGFAWTFEGGEPATSIEENPIVTYNAVGIYDVTLIVSDGTLTDTLLMEDYILVNEAGEIICNNSFEFWTNNLPNCWNGSKTSINVANIIQVSEGAHTGNYAVKLVNASSSHKRFSSQPTTLEAGNSYQISFWTRGTGDIRTALFTESYQPYNDYNTIASNDWTQYTQVVTADVTCSTAEFIFSVKATDSIMGLQIDDVEVVVIVPSVIAEFEADMTEISEDGNVQFTDLSIGSITSWNWSFEGGTPAVSTEQNPSVTYATEGVYDVSLIVSDGTHFDTLVKEDYITVIGGIVIFNQNWNDQQWNGWQQISVIGEQVWSISPNYGIDNSPCAKMTGYSGSAIPNEDWLISPAFNLSTYEGVNLSFQNAYKFDGNALEVFFSNNFDGANPSTATWSPLTYVASSGNYAWTPSGDIALDDFNGENCNIAFKYTCDDAAASTWEIDDILLVAESEISLVANFSATPTSLMTGETVAFTDLSQGNPTGWTWTFEGGTPAVSTEQNPTVTYATEGIFDVTLTISDGTNTDTKLMEDYIIVTATPPAPEAEFTANTTTVFVGEIVSFTDQSLYNPTTWAWTLEGGTPATSTEQNPTVQYLVAGTHNVQLEASNEWGTDVENKADYITVQSMDADFSASSTLVMVDGNATFTDLTTGNPTAWAWTISGPQTMTSTEQNPTFTFTIEGSYSVTLVASNAFESITETKTDYINVITGGDITCNNSFEYWTDSLPDCWNGSKTNIGTANIVQYTESAHTGNSACQLINATSSHKRFTNQPTTIEGGVEYTITFWVRGAGEIRTALFDGVSGQYGYTDYNPYIIVNTTEWEQYSQNITAGGSTDAAEFIFSIRNTVEASGHLQIDDVAVTAAAPPALTANFEANITNIPEGSAVQFTDLSLGTPTGWSWSFEGGTPATSQEQNPSVIYATEGTYDVTLTVSNGTETNSKTIENYITVFGGTIIFNQNWNDQEWNGWQQISVVGDQIWNISPNYGIDNTPCVKMSGYAEGAAHSNEDWLISPSFNLNNFGDVVLSFQNAYSYDGNTLEVFFSNNFNGTDPSAATWQPLTFTASTGSFAWTYSGEISLDAFSGDNCFIAFKYTCDEAAASTWEIDDIMLISASEPTLTANFYATPTTVYVDASATFTDASTGNPTSWSWTFEGGTPATSTEQNPVVTYAAAGTFDVTLTVSDGENSDTKTMTDYITVIPLLLEPDLVITEIMYNSPESGTDTLEFIEIYNNDQEIVNLNGFKLTTAVDFTFPEVLLSPGDYIVVAGNPTAILHTFGVEAYQWAGSLNNTGEEIVLVNPANTIINAVAYSKDAPWPTQANGEGYSLDLQNPDSDNSLPENWALSTGFGGSNSNGDTLWATPGAPFGYFFPLVDFSASSTSVAQGSTVNFSNLTPACNATAFAWNFEGAVPETSTEENPSVVYEDMGSFSVTLTVTNEHGTSSLIKEEYINILNSILEIDGYTTRCYPNPAQNIVTIDTDLQNPIVTVYNIMGQKVLSSSVLSNHQMDISGLESGIYFFQLSAENGVTHTVKIIKCE
ncbi:MAG: PKD domain-containing protein [Bacteroidales bacterium]|nr:PKD domain-containing protein [Bacteroidales bacterium]